MRSTLSFLTGRDTGAEVGLTANSADAFTARRRLLMGLGATCGLLALPGCEFSDPDTPLDASTPPSPSPAPTPAPAPAPPAPPTATWAPNPTFVQGSQIPFDLASTLPSEIVRGGVFSVDAAGARLPTGMTLVASGLLYAGTANVGTTTGVIFRYAEPN